MRREAWIYAKALIYSVFGQFKNTRFSPLAPIFCTIECRFFLIKWRGFNGWGENMNYYLQNMAIIILQVTLLGVLKLILHILLLLQGSILLKTTVKYWSRINRSKYKISAYAIFVFTFTYLFLSPLAIPKFGKPANTSFYLLLATSELSVYYLIVRCTNSSTSIKNLVLFVCATSSVVILHNLTKADFGQNDQLVYLIVSIILTYSALSFFKNRTYSSSKFIETSRIDIFFQLSIFTCNSLPMLSSICHILVQLIYPQYNFRETYKSENNLFILNYLQFFPYLGYLAFFYYCNKALSWIK